MDRLNPNRDPIGSQSGVARRAEHLVQVAGSSALRAEEQGGENRRERERIWQDIKAWSPDPHTMTGHLLTPDGSQRDQTSFAMLRTKIRAVMQDQAWTSLALSAPTAGCGTTTLAVNIAFSLARLPDIKVALIDLNLRRPGIARFLGIEEPFSIEKVLSGAIPFRNGMVRHGDNLAIMPNTRPVANPAEVLQARACATALDNVQLGLVPDIVIFDLPPMLESDDLLAFLPQTDCVLLAANAQISTIEAVDTCERELAARTQLMGIVLNDCRHGLEEFGL